MSLGSFHILMRNKIGHHYGRSSRKRPPRFDIFDSRLRETRLYDLVSFLSCMSGHKSNFIIPKHDYYYNIVLANLSQYGASLFICTFSRQCLFIDGDIFKKKMDRTNKNGSKW